MGSCLLHLPEDEGVTLSGPVLRRLLESGSGDAALLYLCLLHHRGQTSVETAGQELKWAPERTQSAEETLRAMGLLGPVQPGTVARSVIGSVI